MKLFPHQDEVLNLTEGRNKVAVPGFEGLYEIDTLGNVFNSRGVMKPHKKNGYLAINLSNGGVQKHFYIHRLVAEAFIPNYLNLPEVNHIDANKQNNCVENLEWCDRKHNLQHSYNVGLKRCGESHGMHKLTESDVLKIRAEYRKGDRECSLHALGRKYGVSWCTIQGIVTGRLWSHVKGGGLNEVISTSSQGA